MNFRHAPGPWIINGGTKDMRMTYISNRNGRPIADVYTPFDQCDAHLMAASPDMLAALETVHRVLTCENVHSPLSDSELHDIAAIIARAKAV